MRKNKYKELRDVNVGMRTLAEETAAAGYISEEVKAFVINMFQEMYEASVAMLIEKRRKMR